MRAASVLPLKPQPIVSSSKDSYIEGLEELHDSDGRILVHMGVSVSYGLVGLIGSYP